jgi:excisionase family DNA binding protein
MEGLHNESRSDGCSVPHKEGHRTVRHGDLLQKLEEIDEKLSRLSSPPVESSALLTRQDLADRLRCSIRTVDTLVARGEIQALRIRGCIRFSPDAIDAYLRRVAEGGR